MIHELVILQEDMEKLKRLSTITEDEVTGVCLYHIATDLFPYDSIGGTVITGRGNPGGVITDEKIREDVNRFLELSTNYGYVDFHTHSVGTIRIDDTYAYDFSEDPDIISIKRKGLNDPDYRHLLITPRRTRLVRYNIRTDSIVDLPTPRQFNSRHKNSKTLYLLREYISRWIDLL